MEIIYLFNKVVTVNVTTAFGWAVQESDLPGAQRCYLKNRLKW